MSNHPTTEDMPALSKPKNNARLEREGALKMSLGKKLSQLRRQRNWRQKELAERLGVNQKQLVRWENDQSRPRARALEELARVFEVKVEDLTSDSSLEPLEQLDDPELRELLSYLPKLGANKREALKIMLRDMVACYQFGRVASKLDSVAS